MTMAAMAMALGLVSATVAGTIDPAVWPAPASGNPTSEAWASIASTFDIVLPTSVGADTVLGRSAGRYKSKIAALTNTANGANKSTGGSATASVSTLTVMVDDATSLTPFTFPVDESYNLSLVAGGSSVELRAATQWGAMRGFETVLQLCEGSIIGGGAAALPSPLSIQDRPRFHWRGVMMDLARHL
jgi:hexosaminidase